MTNIARDGAAKRLHHCSVHNGMYALLNGQLIAGISHTQGKHPLDDSNIVTAPTVEKRLSPVTTMPGQRPRINTAIEKE
jgi:hypothetical protein